MMTAECKTFDIYIKELVYNPRRSPKWFSDKRLTQLEKKILEGHLLIRSNKNEEVIQSLLNIPQSEILFIHSHWNLILGICHNNIGNYSRGEIYLKEAIRGFEDSSSSYHLFTALFNLFTLLGNVGRVDEMEGILGRMEEISPSEDLAQVRLLRCQFTYAMDANKTDKAYQILSTIETKKKMFSESDLYQHLVCEFIFYIKEENFPKAHSILEELKRFKKYSLSENFIFMSRLLAHLTEDKTIYVYEREFSSLKFLYYQMKVIESLQGKDHETAEEYWSLLQKETPHLYGKNFNYHGEKSLFSLCLEKHLNKEEAKPKIIHRGSGRNACEKLFSILKASAEPLRKGYLYEIVWGEAPETKEDYEKLSKLISKVRRNYNVTIVSRKGTYFIQESKSTTSNAIKAGVP